MPQRLRSGAVLNEYATPANVRTRGKKTQKAQERGEGIPEKPNTVRRKYLVKVYL
jgi:hypothetical protein